jgi:hypothetical protein
MENMERDGAIRNHVKQVCYKCQTDKDYDGHRWFECPNIECNYCHTMGHIANRCINRSKKAFLKSQLYIAKKYKQTSVNTKLLKKQIKQADPTKRSYNKYYKQQDPTINNQSINKNIVNKQYNNKNRYQQRQEKHEKGFYHSISFLGQIFYYNNNNIKEITKKITKCLKDNNIDNKAVNVTTIGDEKIIKITNINKTIPVKKLDTTPIGNQDYPLNNSDNNNKFEELRNDKISFVDICGLLIITITLITLVIYIKAKLHDSNVKEEKIGLSDNVLNYCNKLALSIIKTWLLIIFNIFKYILECFNLKVVLYLIVILVTMFLTTTITGGCSAENILRSSSIGGNVRETKLNYIINGFSLRNFLEHEEGINIATISVRAMRRIIYHLGIGQQNAVTKILQNQKH